MDPGSWNIVVGGGDIWDRLAIGPRLAGDDGFSCINLTKNTRKTSLIEFCGRKKALKSCFEFFAAQEASASYDTAGQYLSYYLVVAFYAILLRAFTTVCFRNIFKKAVSLSLSSQVLSSFVEGAVQIAC
jgi:hypothetical protein